MIEIADIRDRDSLKQWLTDWPKENGLDEDAARAVAVTIAHRAAMRVLPAWWQWTLTDSARKGEVTVLSALRCNLVLAIAGNIPNWEIDYALPDDLSDSIAKADNSAEAFNHFKPEAIKAAEAAVFAYNAATYDAVAVSADSACSAAEAVNADIAWHSLRADCSLIATGAYILSNPIWAITDNPLGWADDDIRLGLDWKAIKSQIASPEWSFWIKWYDDALAGTPPNWKMLEQIALIEPEVWVEGAEAVAGEIAKIVEKFDLLYAVRSLKQARSPLLRSTASAAHRSHNQPPELIDAPVEIAGEITFIWDNLDHAEKELEKSDPDTGWLEEIARAILKGLANIAKYCAKIGDTVITAGAKVVGAAGGGLVLDNYFNNGQVLEFANRLLHYATGG